MTKKQSNILGNIFKQSKNIKDLDIYKKKILNLVYYFSSIFGFIILLYEYNSNLTNINYTYLGIISFLYLIVLFFTFNENISYKVRSFVIGDILFAFAVIININFGPIAPALLLYFSVPVLTALLGSKKNSYLWIIGNSLTILAFEIIYSYNILDWEVASYITSSSALILILIYVIVAFVTVFSINAIIESLSKNISEVQRSKELLEADQQQLVKINNELQKNIKENLINQEKLSKSEEKFKKLFDNAHDSIMIHDFDGTFLDINDSASKRFGISRKNAVGKSILDFLDEENKEVIKERKKELSLKKEVTFESRHLTANNEYIDVENTLQISELNGKEYIINISRDISERKRAERKIENINKSLQEKVYERTVQLEDALEELRIEINERIKAEDELIKAKEEVVNALQKEKELSNMKTKFVSMISHEYRTPLTVILSTTYILEHLFDKNDKQGYLKNIKKIQNSIQLMTNMLEDVLSIGSISDAQTKVNPVKFDIVQLCNDIIDEYKMIEKTKHNYEFESGLKESDVYLDQKLMRHTLRNLIGNASKYSPKNTTVTVKLYDNSENFYLKVSDEGIGIAEQDLEKIYDTFYRSDNVGTISGTGLGLSITKNHIEAMNGKIEVTSKVNEGTEFLVTLPKKLQN